MNPEYSGALQPSGGSKRLITDEDLAYANADKDTFTEALVYVNAVKETFKDRKEKINKVDAISMVKELLKGHHDLLLGFNTFLPKGCEFTLPLDEEAINYVNKIRII
uniref:Uncharacterized protein n=1 Tax=Picea sitchensis TaxID=3332 RepID=B8LMM7_PICSI|nr:unknown [Picea sitchensis]